MSIRSSTLVLAVLAGGLGSLSFAARADQWQDIQQRKELRCGTFADVPPFAAPDPKTREMVGHDVDLCNALAKPVNFMVGIKGRSFSVAELAAAGVRRVSLATSAVSAK